MAALSPKSQDSLTSFGLLAVRVVAGLALSFHGWPKMKNISDWMASMPDPAPGYLQALAALSEFAGGIALAAGLLTPIAALGVLCTMAYAVNFHFSKGDPFVVLGEGHSYELALVYAMIALCLLCSGPGKLSLDSVLFGGKKK